MAKKREERARLADHAARTVGKARNKARARRHAGSPGPAHSRQPKVAVAASRLAEPVPDKAAIQRLIAKLAPVEQKVVRSVLQGLEEHLGSSETARIWLVVKAPEFGTTPLEAIRNGKASVVQAVLEARWGRNPIYA